MLPHIARASTSIAGGSRQRAPWALPQCAQCVVAARHLSTTSPLLVKRPQKPYPYEVPNIDAYGKPYRADPDLGKAFRDDAPYDENAKAPPRPRKNAKRQGLAGYYHELERLAEPTATGWYEKYGAHDGYGLKNKPRYRVSEEGKVEPWDAAGTAWKRKLAFRLRKKVEVPGFQHRRSAKLNPATFRPFARIEAPGFRSGFEERVKAIEGGAQEMASEMASEMESTRPEEVEREREVARERNRDMRARIPTLEPVDIKQMGDIQVERPTSRVKPQSPSGPSPTFGVRKFSTYSPLCKSEAKLIKPMITASSIETKTGKPLGRRPLPETRVPKLDRRKRGGKFVSDPNALRAEQDLRDHLRDSDATQNDMDGQDGRKQPWRPTKKLTYSAMAGLRALHETDPKQYDRAFLADKFGISFEAVSRILRSKWRTKVKPSKAASIRQARPASDRVPETADKSLAGTKWDPNPDTSPTHSPIHAIFQARGGSSQS